MNFNWNLFIDLGIISTALLFATFLRAKVRFFQRFLIPNALTAGLILLPLYNYVFPLVGVTASGLGELAYHLLGISFIAMSLRTGRSTAAVGQHRLFATVVVVLSQFAIQVLVGLLLTFLFISTLYPDLYEPFGYLLPLGFVQGPGQAFAIGDSWTAMGIEGAGSVGLTFAAIGFILATFGGIFLINFGIRRGWVTREELAPLRESRVRTGIYPRDVERPVGAVMTTETEAIDSMSLNAGLVLFGYFLTYLFLSFLTWSLSLVGPLGEELAVNLWGVSFIFAAIIGLGMKHTIEAIRVDHVIDTRTMNRISGLSVDVMVTAAIGAISLVAVSQYWIPIVVLALVGALMTFLTVPWVASRLFTDHKFHRMLLIFGVSTGTLSTGLALLRVIDPDFETPVASDYTYAAGITFVFAIPFILSISLPVRAFVTGNFMYFWMAVGIAIAYLVFVFVSYLVLAKDKAFAGPRHVWLRHRS
ncbi:MAG: sodium:glutamate symporter [Spirochaetes bacterium]|jgi:ESS family glutamate:Na+ symporter|nr:sodium:glutamate symporter [Spirochaetota bacterium]